MSCSNHSAQCYCQEIMLGHAKSSRADNKFCHISSVLLNTASVVWFVSCDNLLYKFMVRTSIIQEYWNTIWSECSSLLYLSQCWYHAGNTWLMLLMKTLYLHYANTVEEYCYSNAHICKEQRLLNIADAYCYSLFLSQASLVIVLLFTQIFYQPWL